MKPLCIVDTSSLIYLSEIQAAKRNLHRWLWDEFDVTYSAKVWEEICRHSEKMGFDAKKIKRNGKDYVWGFPNVKTYDRALFEQPIERIIEVGNCRRCETPVMKSDLYQVNLDDEKNKGERHNCCVAVSAVMSGRYRQVIFLTDDRKAVRNFICPIFSNFPIGEIWSSHDFVLYLFMRHRSRFTRKEVEIVLRTINAKIASSGSSDHSSGAQDWWTKKLTTYIHKAARVDNALVNIQGGS